MKEQGNRGGIGKQGLRPTGKNRRKRGYQVTTNTKKPLHRDPATKTCFDPFEFTRTYTHKHKQTHTHTQARMHARTLNRTHAQLHTQERARTHTYTRTHTHTRAQRNLRKESCPTKKTYTQELFNKDELTHRHFYTEKFSHRGNITHRSFYYAKQPLKKDAVTRTGFNIGPQRLLLHTQAVTERDGLHT